MTDDVLLNKCATIERSLDRIREEYAGDPAMHLVRIHALGVPQETRDAFQFLAKAGYLQEDLSERLMRMVGFRNVAIHEYERLDLEIVRRIIEDRLQDFQLFCELVLNTNGFRIPSSET